MEAGFDEFDGCERQFLGGAIGVFGGTLDEGCSRHASEECSVLSCRLVALVCWSLRRRFVVLLAQRGRGAFLSWLEVEGASTAA